MAIDGERSITEAVPCSYSLSPQVAEARISPDSHDRITKSTDDRRRANHPPHAAALNPGW
jgi:hypothetical protein